MSTEKTLIEQIDAVIDEVMALRNQRVALLAETDRWLASFRQSSPSDRLKAVQTLWDDSADALKNRAAAFARLRDAHEIENAALAMRDKIDAGIRREISDVLHARERLVMTEHGLFVQLRKLEGNAQAQWALIQRQVANKASSTLATRPHMDELLNRLRRLKFQLS